MKKTFIILIVLGVLFFGVSYIQDMLSLAKNDSYASYFHNIKNAIDDYHDKNGRFPIDYSELKQANENVLSENDFETYFTNLNLPKSDEQYEPSKWVIFKSKDTDPIMSYHLDGHIEP